jgi:hypothetical protein
MPQNLLEDEDTLRFKIKKNEDSQIELNKKYRNVI